MTNSLNRSVADVFDTYVYTVGIPKGPSATARRSDCSSQSSASFSYTGATISAKRFGQEGDYLTMRAEWTEAADA